MSSGNATFAIVAQVAADEPDTVPKIPHARTFTCMSRPGSQLSHGASPSNISSDSLVRNRISPIHMNSGSAAMVQFALEPQNDWKRLTAGGELVKNCRPNHATADSAIDIQTPHTSSRTSSASMICLLYTSDAAD